MNIVSHNLSAMFTARHLNIVSRSKADSIEKLSSGYRINRAADDAAGLSISEKMRRQIRGLKQGAENMQDGVSFCQTADGYLEEVVSMLQRMNELSVKAANDTNSASDRADIDNEMRELKEETQRIFSTAKFNETYIFKVPYVPAPIIREDDMKVFSSGLDAAGNVKYGGIEVNDIRHTWEELGIELSDDGKSFASDQEVKFNDSTGELIELHVKAGDPLSNVMRRNYWSADGSGVYINEVFAQSWEDIGIKGSGNKGEYVIKFKGQEICFEVDDGASRDEIEKAISGKNLNTEYTWDLSTSDILSGAALTDLSANSVKVTNSNKNALDSEFKIRVYNDGSESQSGVTVTKDGSDMTKTSWRNLAGGGEKPISDWGLSNNGLGSGLKTIDSSAVYTYTNTSPSDLSISFSFKLKEEAGLDEVTAALDGVELKKSFSAPNTLTGTGTESGSASNPVVSMSKNKLDYDIQKAYGRNFNDPNADMKGTVKRKLVQDSAESVEYKNNSWNSESIGKTAVSPGSDNYAYVKDSNGKYYKVTKSQELQTKTRTGSRDRVENYKGHYSYYEPEFMGTSLDPVGNSSSFNYASTINESISQSQTRTVTTYGAYDPDNGGLTEEEFQALSASEQSKLISSASSGPSGWSDDPAWSGWSEISVTGSTQGSTNIKGYLESNIELKSSSNGSIGTMKIKDTAGSLAGDATLYFNYKASDFATCSFSASEKRAGNKNSEVQMRNVNINVPPKELDIQAQAANPDYIAVKWSGLNNGILGIQTINTRTVEEARFSIDQVAKAIKVASDTRSTFGAQQNRLEHAIKVNNNTMENTQAAESIIRDTDMAREMVKYSKESILEQVGQAMLTQANQQTEGVLALLK